MIVKSAWIEELPKDRIQQMYDENNNNTGRTMRQLSPDSGCYVNEVSHVQVLALDQGGRGQQCDKFESNWRWTMYGPEYSRLRAIKAKYDPDDLLWCWRCVGSETERTMRILEVFDAAL